jgi:hypothetical protein
MSPIVKPTSSRSSTSIKGNYNTIALPGRETLPMCQDRICNLGAEMSKKTPNDPILTGVEPRL